MLQITEDEWLNLYSIGAEKLEGVTDRAWLRFENALMSLEAVNRVYCGEYLAVLWPQNITCGGDYGQAVRTLAYLGHAPGCKETSQLVYEVCNVLWDYCFEEAEREQND